MFARILPPKKRFFSISRLVFRISSWGLYEDSIGGVDIPLLVEVDGGLASAFEFYLKMERNIQQKNVIS